MLFVDKIRFLWMLRKDLKRHVEMGNILDYKVGWDYYTVKPVKPVEYITLKYTIDKDAGVRFYANTN